MAETTTLPTIWRVTDELWAHIHALSNQYDHRIGEEKKDDKGEKRIRRGGYIKNQDAPGSVSGGK